MKWRIFFLSILVLAAVTTTDVGTVGAGEKAYVGTSKCKECHEEIYKNFCSTARKASSFASVRIMSEQLTEAELKECYGCHTTGYGKPGGFISVEKTPDLANAGCEVCHGPGSEHVESGGDPGLIIGKGKISLKENCGLCHNSQRVGTFGYRPVLHSGAH